MMPVLIIAGSIAIALVLMLVLRELWCWYWKINRKLALMEEQNELLRKIHGNTLIILEINREISSKIDSSLHPKSNHIIDTLV
jgi:hypothetical protein